MTRSLSIHGALTPGTRNKEQGVRNREGDALLHASLVTEGLVDNPLASATATLGSQAACNAFGEIGRWA